MEPAAPTDTTVTASVESPVVHPLFTELFANADVTLLSKDGFLFPISSETLARVSGWFHTMFTIPQQPSGSPNSSNEPIAVSESADTLAALLSIVSGTSLPHFHDIDFVETLLFTAEKYDMPFPVAILRLALPSFLDTHPVRVYGMACRMSWEAEAQKAVGRILAVNFLSPEKLLELRHVETPYVVKLLSLHERRRVKTNEELDSTVSFNVANTFACCRFCGERCAHTSWAMFKLAWSREPWRVRVLRESGERPSTIPELVALLEAQCKCGGKYYDESASLENLRALARSLPETIEWE
ncbi:hypothetical protein C8T65DRAFT_626620 [Cerioporus squamosus]|nr:hypothetical protein C8T65DRAFT_626620 [Cerioporus squamosus]